MTYDLEEEEDDDPDEIKTVDEKEVHWKAGIETIYMPQGRIDHLLLEACKGVIPLKLSRSSLYPD